MLAHAQALGLGENKESHLLARAQVLGLGENKLTDDALRVLAPELVALEALTRIRLDNNCLQQWSCDWGVGHVGKDVLQRWLVRDGE